MLVPDKTQDVSVTQYFPIWESQQPMKKKKKEGIKHNWERQAGTGRDRPTDIFVQKWKALIPCLAASAPSLWATSKMNGDHYHGHAAPTPLVQPRRSSWTPAQQTHRRCLTKHTFSYGSEMSGVRPIRWGQENTDGLCWCLWERKEPRGGLYLRVCLLL